jgi:hypothetical protein
LCGEVLSNDSLKTNKFKRLVVTKHPQHDGEPRELFQNRGECFRKQGFESGRVSQLARHCCHFITGDNKQK